MFVIWEASFWRIFHGADYMSVLYHWKIKVYLKHSNKKMSSQILLRPVSKGCVLKEHKNVYTHLQCSLSLSHIYPINLSLAFIYQLQTNISKWPTVPGASAEADAP